MSFLQYVGDKRYFLLVYAVLMLFVSLLMLLGMDGSAAGSNIAYANAGGLLIAAVYLGAGYSVRRSYYRRLAELAADAGERDDPAESLPEPQTAGQALTLELVRAWRAAHDRRLRELLADKRDHQDFILSWIHEVKLPIAASRLILENRYGLDADELADKLEDELAHIDAYVEQALYYSRIDSFSRDYLITELQLNSLLKDSVKKYAKLFIAGRIRVELPEGEPAVSSDGKWLGYIIDQLVANSLKYTGSGGTIAFRYEEDRQEKRLIVTDTGIGIQPEDLPRVFDKGFTGANGRTHRKSTGMGLYLARQMALKLGHDLSAASEAGHGTRMTIHFPKNRSYLHM